MKKIKINAMSEKRKNCIGRCTLKVNNIKLTPHYGKGIRVLHDFYNNLCRSQYPRDSVHLKK